MVRSTTSLPLALVLALAGCHVTIVPAPAPPAGSSESIQPVEEDTAGIRRSKPLPTEDESRPSMPAPARIVVVSPEAWSGRNPGTLEVDRDQAVRLVGRVDYAGRVSSVRVNGDRAAVTTGDEGATFVAVVRPPRRGAMNVRVDVATPTGNVSSVYALRVASRTATITRPPRPADGGVDEPPVDTGAIVVPVPPRRGQPVEPPADSAPDADPTPPPADSTPAPPPDGDGPDATPEPARSPADSAWAARDRWVVVIGIDEYATSGTPARRYAAEDARAVEAFLRSPAAGSIPPARIRTLINGEATRAGIRAALTGFLAQASREDVVLVYLTGTGAPDPSHPNAAFILPHDAPAAPTAATAISAEWLAETLAELDVHQKILLADVLYAGERKGNRPQQNLVHRTLVRTTGPRKGGIVAITSAGDAATSQEGAQYGGGHGVFTHHVLAGLGGAGDDDRDGVITLAELVKHARERVEGATRGQQKPGVSAAAYDRQWPMATRPSVR